jgi:hypothetical protein
MNAISSFVRPTPYSAFSAPIVATETAADEPSPEATGIFEVTTMFRSFTSA